MQIGKNQKGTRVFPPPFFPLKCSPNISSRLLFDQQWTYLPKAEMMDLLFLRLPDVELRVWNPYDDKIEWKLENLYRIKPDRSLLSKKNRLNCKWRHEDKSNAEKLFKALLFSNLQITTTVDAIALWWVTKIAKLCFDNPRTSGFYQKNLFSFIFSLFYNYSL